MRDAPFTVAVEDLRLRLPDGRVLFSGAGFTVEPGEILAIEGPNGAGKTSLLLAIEGRWHYFDGRIRFGIPRRRIAHLPQLENRAVHGPFTLADAAETAHPKADDPFAFLLENLPLRRRWNDASGGERKRSLLYRALSREPALLLLDEPMNHLDGASRKLVRRAVQRYLERGGAAILVSHQGSETHASLFGDRWKRLCLGDGK